MAAVMKWNFMMTALCRQKHETGKYETIDNHLRILDMGFMGHVLSYDCEINGDTLILINDSGIRREYTKRNKIKGSQLRIFKFLKRVQILPSPPRQNRRKTAVLFCLK